MAALASLALLAGCQSTPPRPISLEGNAPNIQPKAASTGPTIYFARESGESPINSISALMYFVKLISPEPVTMSVNTGNTQQCRVIAIHRDVKSDTFKARCQFEITGEGTQQNLFDQRGTIQRNHQRLSDGGSLMRQLGFIKVRGAGQGDIRVAGRISEGEPIVDQISLHFADRGDRLQVTIGINDIRYINGNPHAVNDQVIQVNSLEFRRQDAPPKMNVSVDSIKSAVAGNGLLSNLMGKVKGVVVNLLIPPVPIREVGNDAMLNFAQAIVDGRLQFAFPLAE
jgi:hypothetical protein